MSKKMMVKIGAMVLACALSFGSVSALAVSGTTSSVDKPARSQMTEAQKSEMEAMKAEREAKETAFIQTLTTEQKALYEAMRPAKPTGGESSIKLADGKGSVKPDEAAMAEIKAKEEAFIASLTETQKAAYDELFARKDRELSETQKSEMEAMKAEREAKEATFIQTLSEEQKVLYEAIKPAKPADGEKAAKPDDSAMANMKAQQEAFVNSLTAEQKAAFESLGSMRFGSQPPNRPQQ